MSATGGEDTHNERRGTSRHGKVKTNIRHADGRREKMVTSRHSRKERKEGLFWDGSQTEAVGGQLGLEEAALVRGKKGNSAQFYFLRREGGRGRRRRINKR